jgi:site-specific recombinase XerD
MAAVGDLVSGLDAELVRLGYQPSTLKWYRGYWRRLERYFASRGVEEFSLDVAMEWVDEACGGFFVKEQAGTLKQTDVYVFRVAAMLDDFAVHGSVLRRYSRSVSKLSAKHAEVLAGFQAWLRTDGCAVSTVRAYGTVAGEFLAFTGSRGGLAALDGAVIGAFVQTLAGYQPKTVEHKLCAVRSLLRFAAAGGLTDRGVLETVPAVRSTRQARVPSVWDPVDVARVLEAIDRGNPSGKRDYAIVLLICRLGLRAVDVKRLEFADLDWSGNRLSVVQAKTGRRVDLPLLKDVGWAIIDYVREGRPASDCRHVFLRHTAPIGPFSDQDHLHQILVKHARVAHVSLSEKRRHGMHSLRHTLATRLMEDGTPVEQIADILGHQSVESTGVYLKSSLGLLAWCALDPDAPASEVSR